MGMEQNSSLLRCLGAIQAECSRWNTIRVRRAWRRTVLLDKGKPFTGLSSRTGFHGNRSPDDDDIRAIPKILDCRLLADLRWLSRVCVYSASRHAVYIIFDANKWEESRDKSVGELWIFWIPAIRVITDGQRLKHSNKMWYVRLVTIQKLNAAIMYIIFFLFMIDVEYMTSNEAITVSADNREC